MRDPVYTVWELVFREKSNIKDRVFVGYMTLTELGEYKDRYPFKELKIENISSEYVARWSKLK